MMKKFTKNLDIISVISWIITIGTMMTVMYLEMNNIAIEWAWNELSRSYTSASMIVTIQPCFYILVIVAGSVNALSVLLRHLFKNNVIEEDEIIYLEDEEA